MRITDLEVDRFGLWEGLKLENLSDELTVFYGPNETGKTTLMQFVRGVLYGFTPERRGKYLHAFKSGRAGGAVHVASNHDRFGVSRHASGPDDAGDVSLKDRGGAKLGPSRLTELLGGVDETTFINVFACGLREIQELGTLSDTEAANLLYDLTMGTDRVSLTAAVREVDGERNRLLSGDVRHSAIAQLLADRDRLRAEIDGLSELTPKYLQLCSQRSHLDREIEQHSGTEHIDREIRHVELAKAVGETWKSRAELDRRLAEFGPNDGVAAELLVKLDEIDAKLTERRRRRKILFRRRRKLRRDAKAIQVNDTLCQSAAKLDAVSEQQSWMGSLWTQLKKLEDEVAELELAAEAPATLWLKPTAKPTSLGAATPVKAIASTTPPQLSDRALADLRVAAKSMSDARRRFRALKGDLGLPATGDTVELRIRAVLGDRIEGGLHDAVGEAGENVSLLRRRIQLEEKLEQMIRREKELGAQSTEWLERQQLPTWQVATLGGFFIFGAALIFLYMAGWVLPATVTGRLGWPLALLGLASTTFAGLGKVALEQSASSELEQCRRQLDALNEQLAQSREERNAIDERLPKGGGPLTVRLRDAEKDLAELEALLPLESQREAAAHLSRDYQRRRKQTKADAINARKRWKSALAAAGWPETVSPRQFHEYRKRFAQAKEAMQVLRHKRDELSSRQREYGNVADRIFHLATEVGMGANGTTIEAAMKLKEMQSALADHTQRRDRRDGLRRQSGVLRGRQTRYERSITSLVRKREHLLINSGFNSEEEARARALRFAEVQQLERQRAALAQQIALMLGIQATEEMVGKYLDGRDLDQTHTELSGSLASIRSSLQGKLEHRAELTQQIRLLAEDKHPVEKRLELASLERRIELQTDRWRTLAVAGSLLNGVQASYEKNRQPVALREATEFMSRMTNGKYTRVWTPLGEPELRVDVSDGKSLPVEVLSAGTREQLFLSLRLALVKLYAERGIKLPVVLDDVLVNFDTVRAKAAAEVLRDFARGGHQLLVFTCHEHIARMFKALKVDVRELPIAGRIPNVLDEPEETPPPKERKRKEPTPPVEPIVVMLPPPDPVPLAPIEVRFQRIEYDAVARKPVPRAKSIPRVRIDRPEPVEFVAPPPPPPKPARKQSRKLALRVERVEWDAEEFSGELRDQVSRRVAAAEGKLVRNDNTVVVDDDLVEVEFVDGTQ